MKKYPEAYIGRIQKVAIHGPPHILKQAVHVTVRNSLQD